MIQNAQYPRRVKSAPPRTQAPWNAGERKKGLFERVRLQSRHSRALSWCMCRYYWCDETRIPLSRAVLPPRPDHYRRQRLQVPQRRAQSTCGPRQCRGRPLSRLSLRARGGLECSDGKYAGHDERRGLMMSVDMARLLSQLTVIAGVVILLVPQTLNYVVA